MFVQTVKTIEIFLRTVMTIVIFVQTVITVKLRTSFNLQIFFLGIWTLNSTYEL